MEGLKCEICGSFENIETKTKNNRFNMILCKKHYLQLYNYNKIYRTCFDKNEIIIYDDYAEIIIFKNNKKGESAVEKCRAIIDIEDVEKIRDFKWYESHYGYVVSDKNSKHEKLYLSHVVLDSDLSTKIDHKDRNPLNNRKENLRKCTQRDNSKNKSILKNNTSGYTGISWNKEKSKWEVYLAVDYKRKKLGYYKDLEEAKYIRYKAEIDYFKDFAPDYQEKIEFISNYEKENNINGK